MSPILFGDYLLPEDQRQHFKPPLGKLYVSEKEIITVIENLKKDSTIPRIITVGDATTSKLLSYSLVPDVAIVDDYIERQKVSSVDTTPFIVETAENPAGLITSESWLKIRDALKNESSKIIIKIIGEEDLLVLPAILEASLDSKVLYGQPKKGLVLVSITEERKKHVQKLMQKLVKT